MTPLFKKLNYKGQKSITIVQAPDSFEGECKAMEAMCSVKRKVGAKSSIEWVLVFVTTLDQIEAAVQHVVPLLNENAVFWMAYPKGTSKRYKCEFNRDNGWAALGALGFEGVRMVAIDEDWSGLRFKHVEAIKQFTRSSGMAISPKGKTRANMP
jgi:hypothetical protein